MIDALGDKEELSAYLAQSGMIGGGGPFIFYIGIDGKDSTRYAIHLWQGGLGLPDRDYYFNDDERSVELREAYVVHIEKMFELAGFDRPAESAAMLMDLEARIAESHWTRVENRDSDKRYNLFATEDLGELGTGVNWPAYFEAAGVADEKDIIINQPSFIEGFNQVFAEHFARRLEDLHALESAE